jgi:hypothetical protein
MHGETAPQRTARQTVELAEQQSRLKAEAAGRRA